ncbi:hypothetical protein Tco_0366107 [Tanacetum coccineum]
MGRYTDWPSIYLNAQLSSYTSGHLEVSELAAYIEKLYFPALLVMSKFSRICFSFEFKLDNGFVGLKFVMILIEDLWKFNVEADVVMRRLLWLCRVCHLPSTFRSKMSFQQALDLIFKLDDITAGCTQDILRQRDRLDRFSEVPCVILALMVVKSEVLNVFPRFFGVLVAEFATGGAVNLILTMKRDLIIKDLDLEPKIDATMRDFLEMSLRSVVVLPDVGLDTRTEVHGKSIRFAPSDGVGSQRHHFVPIGDLNDVLIALVARSGVISKSTDRIIVSYGG